MADETRNRIDEALAQAQAEVAKLGTALFDLDSEKERRRAELPPLTGSTEAAWNLTGSQLSVLWAWYQALAGMVEMIADQRKAPGLRQADLNGIWTLLCTPSVEIPEDSRQLAQECLPESDRLPEKVPWAVLVRVISAVYQRVAETVTSIFAVRDVALPRVQQLDQALRDAANRTSSLGLRLPNQARAVLRQLEDLQQQLNSDPLSVDVEMIPILADEVERARGDLMTATDSMANVGERLAALGSALDAAVEEIRDAEDAVETARAKIEGLNVRTVDVASLESSVRDLRGELGEVAELASEDRPGADRAARILDAKVTALRSEAGRLSAAAAEPMATRQELRGRLDAYRAKAYALGRGEDTHLDRLYRAARQILYTAPCDLAAAERRLEAYQSAVLASPMEDRLT
ncbi:MAG TPA: hypothetical protein VLX59_05275 [Acidimicrobiales bacterium]|nr:hypothetical protein [Acidimicrobiales bacterium]